MNMLLWKVDRMNNAFNDFYILCALCFKIELRIIDNYLTRFRQIEKQKKKKNTELYNLCSICMLKQLNANPFQKRNS